VWSYTPRRIEGYIMFALKRRRAEMREAIITQVNARGDEKSIKKVLKDLERDVP
jgi:hypothetical protein